MDKAASNCFNYIEVIFSVFQITCHDNKDGTVSVSYLPTAPGEYKISVRFGDKHIKGSPYTAKVCKSKLYCNINKFENSLRYFYLSKKTEFTELF